jgi:predicted nucleotidyltransferase
VTQLKGYFDSTTQQQVLAFLASHPGRSYYDKEVREATGLSSGATNQALRELAGEGYIKQEKKGRMSFYSVDLSNPLIAQYKVLLNVASIYPLIRDLEEYAIKIVMFGSMAQGTNIEESDIDLFVLTNTPEKVAALVSRGDFAEKIQLVAKKPTEWASLKKKDPVFYEEVERGILLWEAK